MKSKLKIISLLFLAIFLISGAAFSAPRFLFVAPGESYTPPVTPPGTNKSGTPLPQVSGVPFSVTIYSVDDSNWALLNTNENTTLSASQTTAYNPASPFFLSDDSISPAVIDCKRIVTITIDPSVSSAAVTITATGIGGTASSSIVIPVQKINNLQFNPITSPQAAGTPVAFTLTARQSNGATATSFNGSASISAVYSGQYTYISPNPVVTFSAGVATGSITLFDSTEGPQRVTLSASVTVPSGVAAGLSQNFIVSPAAAVKLLLIGPGQSIDPGNSINASGRTGSGSITETASTVTAGATFSVTVYAVDAYWNTVTTASGFVTLTASDALATTPAATALASGKAIMSVTLGTFGTVVLTASMTGLAQDTDNVPVTFGALHHFDFTNTNQPMTDKTANQTFLIYAVAHDAYNNVVQDFNASVALEALKAGTTPLAPLHYFKTQSNPTFINGVLDGTIGMKIYERLSACNLRLTYNLGPTATGMSTPFAVNPAAFNKLLIMAPGEGYDPGSSDPADDGKSGTPSAIGVGANPIFTVLACDSYWNQVTSINDTIEITSTDTKGFANSVTPPVQTVLTGGIQFFNFSFASNGSQSIYCSDITTPAAKYGSVTVSVQAGTLAYFDIGSLSSPQLAGGSSSPVVTARDSFGNPVSSYNGNAWVTSPDTDWILPAESTINISNGTLYGAAWYVTFTSGTATLNTSFRRSGSARIFACDDPAGTTQNAIGHRGLSAAVNVIAGSVSKLQVIVPGTSSRPGTLDGIDGTPSGQVMSTQPLVNDNPFSVTVSACDDWWNVITSGTGSNAPITLNTYDNPNARAAKAGSALQVPPVATSLTSGSVLMNVAYGVQRPNFSITASTTLGGVSPYTTQSIYIFDVHHFTIKGASSINIDQQWVDTPFTITITAYDYINNIMTGFDNIQVELRASNQDSDTYFTMKPRLSVTFTAGVAVMQVRMFKAETTWTGSGAFIQVNYGTKKATSNNFNLWWQDVSNVLVTVTGMQHTPGLKEVGIPGYAGYTGRPIVMTAGQPFEVNILYLDPQYNRVWTYPATTCKISSTDPQASVDGIPLASSTVDVNVTAGIFTSSNMRLCTVGTAGIQKITAEPAGFSPNTSPEISLRHYTHDHFGIQVPPESQIAGVPFNINIQALDAFQNVCGSLNDGIPFNSTVNLEASTNPNTMYPYNNVPMQNGQSVTSVRLFKATVLNATIKASYSSITGSSGVIAVYPNEFKRLLLLDSNGGLVPVNGEFTGTAPIQGAFPMVTGSPFALNANDAVVSWQNTSVAPYDHFGQDHPFKVVSCDEYGNTAYSPDSMANTVTITINDQYANAVTPTTIDSSDGEADISLIFHTAKPGMFVTAHTTQPGIADYTTPTFTTMAGPAFGLQSLVPGLIPVDGSAGMVNATEWYTGVTGVASSQYTGSEFPITVRSCDIFGNFQSSASNQIIVRPSSTTNIQAFPDSFPMGAPNSFTGNLGDFAPGILTITAKYTVSAARDVPLEVNDQTLSGPSRLVRNITESLLVPIVMSGSLRYEIIVKGIGYGNGSNHVTATCVDAFAMTVNIVDAYSGKPVYGVNDMFRLTAVLASDLNTPAGGTLTDPIGGIGSVTNGVFTSVIQTYDRAQQIRIRADNPVTGSGVQTGPQYSCVIDFGANSLNAGMTASAVPPSIGSGQVSEIRALVVDSSGNSVVGREVEFVFLPLESTSRGSFDQNMGTPLLTTTTTTNAQGVATAHFTGDFVNGRCKIKVRYFGNTLQERDVFVSVSLVDPASQISNYPNPFAAGDESTNISFFVETPVDVSLKIYSLIGKLVLEKTYSQNEVADLLSTNGNMITYVWDGKNTKGKIVGNGGYICLVDAGSVKYRRKIAVIK